MENDKDITVLVDKVWEMVRAIRQQDVCDAEHLAELRQTNEELAALLNLYAINHEKFLNQDYYWLAREVRFAANKLHKDLTAT